MKAEEFEIIRALSINLDNDTIFVLSYQYHTEKDPQDPEGKKNLKSASRYRMLGFVDTKANIEKRIHELHTDAFRLKPWKWPNDPDWNGVILYMKDASNEGQSNWLRLKLKKAVSKEIGLKLLAGYKKDTKKNSLTFGKYVVYTPNAVYDTKGYSCSDGSTIDIDDLNLLLSKKGQNIWKEIKMKFVGPSSIETNKISSDPNISE